jgi:epsilon-lactone hydrolase
MPSKQSEAVRRHRESAWLTMTQPGYEGPDNESWGDLTAEPRGVDYLETQAGGRPAMWAVPKGAKDDRVLLDVFPGMLHTFQMAAGRAPEADDAIRAMADWVQPRLGL